MSYQDTSEASNTVVLYQCVKEIQTNVTDPATGNTTTNTEQVSLSRTDTRNTATRTITIQATFTVPANMDIDLDDDQMEELIIMMKNLSIQ